MKKKLTLKKELKTIINRKVLKKSITISSQKEGYQLNKNNFLVNLLNKKEIKFPLFYKELKKNFNIFSSKLAPSIILIFTPYIAIKKVKLLKNFYINSVCIINKINALFN